MMNITRTEYVNTQAMLHRNSQRNPAGVNPANADPINADPAEEKEKQQRMLKEEKQSIQNSLLLMKTTSGDSVGSEESIELLEKKLEEIESRIRAEEKAAAEVPAKDGNLKNYAQENAGMRRQFDVYCRGE